MDGGAVSFENPIKLGMNPEGVKTPPSRSHHGKSGVYVVWREHTQVTYSSPGVLMEVKVFDNTINLSNNAGEYRRSVVVTASSGVVSNDNVYVAWVDDLSSPNANEILYRRSINGGVALEIQLT